MARSGGITFAAVVVFCGSTLTGLLGAIMVLATVLASLGTQWSEMPVSFGNLASAEAIVFFGFCGWGIATGIGLIRLQSWARVSMVVFSCILLVFSLPSGIVFAFIPFPAAKDPNLPSNFMTVLRVLMTSFYGLIASLAGFWFYFFNRKFVKEQFLGQVPSREPIDGSRGRASARPLSISIIGWFLLISAGISPFCLLLARTMFPDRGLPFCFLGVFFFGRTGFLLFAAWCLAQVIAAIGLLKLRKWGWLLAMCL